MIRSDLIPARRLRRPLSHFVFYFDGEAFFLDDLVPRFPFC